MAIIIIIIIALHTVRFIVEICIIIDKKQGRELIIELNYSVPTIGKIISGEWEDKEQRVKDYTYDMQEERRKARRDIIKKIIDYSMIVLILYIGLKYYSLTVAM